MPRRRTQHAARSGLRLPGALLLGGAHTLAVKPLEQLKGLELVSRDVFFKDQGETPFS